MNFLRKIFAKKNLISRSTTPTNELSTHVAIPEPTKSLLWITNENASKIRSAGSIRITITLSDTGVKTTQGDPDDSNNFFSEPSLIWTKLPVLPNSSLETKPMYYPSYSGLSPAHRYQYLKWLANVEQPTNLSYVFLYYYGLERHLLIGNYDGAVDEILRLIKFHDRGTFKSYATTALLVASLERKRPDIFQKAPFLLEQLTNEGILLRFLTGNSLTAKEVMSLASQVGFKNKRYIKLRPVDFEEELQNRIDRSEISIKNTITLYSLKTENSTAFANLSIPDHIRTIKIPQILYDERFKANLLALLEQTHEAIKNRPR